MHSIDELRSAVDSLWAEMPTDRVKELMVERPDLVALCQDVHEELWHDSPVTPST